MARGFLQHRIKLVPVDKLRPNPWNPQKMSDAQFERLCENIRKVGFVEPIIAAPIPGEDGCYQIVGGEHRWKAAKVVGLQEVPIVEAADWDVDIQKVQTVKLNILHGRLDPIKFSKLYDELATKYGAELTKEMMGFVDEAAFREVYHSVKAGLPKDLADKLERSKKEIRTVDDLGHVLNAIFAEHGETLAHGFLVFSFLGKEHIYVELKPALRKRVLVLTEQAVAEGRDVNEVFLEALG